MRPDSPVFLYFDAMKQWSKSFIPVLIIGLISFKSTKPENEFPGNDNRLFATAWFALSAEKAACYLQTYQLAGLQLENNIKSLENSKKMPAIVTDLDETALDNSAWSIKVLLEGKDYPAYWSEWEMAGKAPAFPGAIDFFLKAKSLNVPVFYISNRSAKNLNSTIRNLKALGFPNADSSHILLKTNTSNKVERRSQVLKNHEIIMLLGDNLADFDGVWEEAETEKRLTAVTDNSKNWGRKFIIFPNPMYGGWKESVFKYKRNLTKAQSDSVWNLYLGNYLKQYSF